MATNYVRFLKGAPTAYQAIKDSNKISENTLYFISESDAATGKLYLGSKLIAGAGSDSSIPTNIGELANVVTDNAATGSILVYTDDEKWEAKTASEVASLIIATMKGATETEDGASGLVPVPTKDDRNLFLRGDATWANPVANVESKLNKLIGDNSDKTLKEIVAEELASQLVAEDAAEGFQTLKEVTDWIKNHPGDVTTINSNISDLQTSVSNLKDLLNDKTETDGETVATKGLITRVGDLENSILTANTNITNILDKLQWHELNDDGTED